MNDRELPPTELLLVGKAAWLDLQDQVRRRNDLAPIERMRKPAIDAPWTAVIRALLVDYDITPKSGTACENRSIDE